MAISTFPLNGIEYSAADFSSFFCTRTSGVYAEDNFDITVTGSDMQATIGSGMAWMKLSPTSGIDSASSSDSRPISVDRSMPSCSLSILIRFQDLVSSS